MSNNLVIFGTTLPFPAGTINSAIVSGFFTLFSQRTINLLFYSIQFQMAATTTTGSGAGAINVLLTGFRWK